jgi:hypothetical protein
MMAVMFEFGPMMKELLNVWTFNFCSAMTWTYLLLSTIPLNPLRMLFTSR